MKLTVAGCSPAWPNPGGAQSGYLVEGESGRLLLDCGPGVLPQLRVREGWPRLDAIAISHFHLDHWGDLVPWTWGLMFGPAHELEPPELWLPPGGTEQLRTFGRSFGTEKMFEITFPIREYAEAVAFGAASLEVMPVRVPHYGLQCFGFRVTGAGATVAYSADSGPADALTDLARDADLFICEATLAESREEGARGHLSLEEAAAAFEASGARRLLVTHRPAELPLGPGFEQARDGMEIEI
ncbi:MAG: MBL fold metallo-hydrolase [Actinomycetota bacterium]|nr:MBL fold metallo-hydrolase [Actinomycetota bacterium]